jgi:hypothetical protein
MQTHIDRAFGKLGLFLIVVTSLAVDRLPREKSGPLERVVGYGSRLVLGAIGLIGRLCDRLPHFAPERGGRSELLGEREICESPLEY